MQSVNAADQARARAEYRRMRQENPNIAEEMINDAQQQHRENSAVRADHVREAVFGNVEQINPLVNEILIDIANNDLLDPCQMQLKEIKKQMTRLKECTEKLNADIVKINVEIEDKNKLREQLNANLNELTVELAKRQEPLVIQPFVNQIGARTIYVIQERKMGRSSQTLHRQQRYGYPSRYIV